MKIMVLMISSHTYIKILIDVVELRLLSYKGQLWWELKTYNQIVLEMIVH
jgi:hypothetical protein